MGEAALRTTDHIGVGTGRSGGTVLLAVPVADESQQLVDSARLEEGRAHGSFAVDAVAGATSLAQSRQVSGFGQVGEDRVGRAFADSDLARKVGYAQVRLARDPEQ